MEEIRLAVEVVAAGLDREVDDAARRVAELGRVAAGRDRELLEGVRTRCDLREERAVLAAPRLRPVNQDIRAQALAAVDAEVGGVGAGAAGGRACCRSVV